MCALASLLSRAFFDVLARGPQKRSFEMVAHERAAGFEELGEEREQLALCRLGLTALRLDALAHVTVEEVDRRPRGAVDAGRMFLAKLDHRAQWNAGRDQPHAGRDRIEVVGWVTGLVAPVDGDEQPRLHEAGQQR